MRRVVTSSVSVFVALKYRRDVVLMLYERDADGNPTGSAGESKPTRTLRLGSFLHVAVVTAEALNLRPDVSYAYDLRFSITGQTPAEGDVETKPATLRDFGLLGGDTPIGYRPDKLPSFCVPPAEAQNLHFLHASCRKLHGPGLDAMPFMDDEVEKAAFGLSRRPQFLLLTGDQIYADDVGAPMLAWLTEAGSLLMGWSGATGERIPVGNTDAPVSALLPGSRRLVAEPRIKFSSGAAHSHLLGLGEFYAMYLMAWSDAIWPATPDGWPSMKSIYPPEIVEGGIGNIEGLKGLGLSADDVKAELTKYLGARGARWFNESASLSVTRKRMRSVRRVLANVPAYMVFDDHEVTDDWNLDRDWIRDAYSAPGTRQVVGNALAAYAVFQAWGNDPTGQFSPKGPGAKILEAIEKVGKLLGREYLPGRQEVIVLHKALGINETLSPPEVQWDFSFEADGYRVIALDTRTRRDTASPGKIGLITLDEQDRQITQRSTFPKPLTIVVSAPPVFGHRFVEEAVSLAVNLSSKVDSKPEVRIIRWLSEKLAPKSRTASTIVGKEVARFVDYENWANPESPACFEGLLERLSALGRVILLSGDVHYAFSVGIEYWNERGGLRSGAAMAQLCASSLKNEDSMTRMLGKAGSRSWMRHLHDLASGKVPIIQPAAGYMERNGHQQISALYWFVNHTVTTELPRALTPAAQADFLGWSEPPVHLLGGKTSGIPALTTRPAVLPLSENRGHGAVLPAAEWSYRVRFAIDLGAQPSATLGVSPSTQTPRQRAEWVSGQALSCGPDDSNLIVVGHNNFGVVTVMGSDGPAWVRHDINWFQDGNIRPRRTVHTVSLEPPIFDESRPGKPLSSPFMLADLSLWMELICRRSPADLKEFPLPTKRPLLELGIIVQLENCAGPLYVDFLAVSIRSGAMPSNLPGQISSGPCEPEDLLRYLRWSMVKGAVLIDKFIGEFRLDNSLPSSIRWTEDVAAARGCLLNYVDANTPSEVIQYACVASDDSHFVLSTLGSRNPRAPAGHREFGCRRFPDGSTSIYTLGAFRSQPATGAGAHSPGNLMRNVMSSIFRNLLAQVTNLGGQATTSVPVEAEFDWAQVMSVYFTPNAPH